MHRLPDITSRAWVSLFWSQYNKLSEPLKKGYIDLAQGVYKEAKRRKIRAVEPTLPETEATLWQKMNN